jgi:beta,beta-carotene 9',10'-dioxygenase
MAPVIRSLEQEYDLPGLEVEGKIPDWLNGSLIRNGPGKFEINGKSVRHWLDGYAMLHKFDIDGDRVTYRNKILHTESYKQDLSAGKIVSQCFGTVPDPCQSLFQKIRSTFSPVVDNTNVNVVQVGEHHAAISDLSPMLTFDFDTLATKGPLRFKDKFEQTVMLSAAHPAQDHQTGELFNAVSTLGPMPRTYLYKISPDRPHERQILAKIKSRGLFYFHSFALTPQYLVMVECPLRLSLWKMMKATFANRGVDTSFEWRPEQNCRFHVLHRATGKLQCLEAPPFFAFHIANSFETGEGLVIDLCRYQNPEVFNLLYIDKLQNQGMNDHHLAQLYRYRLDLQANRITSTRYSSDIVEMPQVSPRVAGQPYRYLYLSGRKPQTPQRDFMNQLVKFDLKNKQRAVWYQAGTYPSEPIFVPNPHGQAEDDGVVLSLVLDADQQHSFLLVLDAASFAPLARVQVPHHIPPDIHGGFFSRNLPLGRSKAVA